MLESRTLEFKEKLTNTFLKTVSAYANYGTGRILFGVNDQGETVGVKDLREDCLRIENAINDTLDPIPDFNLAVNEADQTIELTVYKGQDTPYYYQGHAYRRTDTSTVKVDRLALNRLVREGLNLTFDALESNNQALTFAYLGKEFEEKLNVTTVDRNSLISLELMTPGGAYTNAGELFADTNSFVGLDIARFGDSINIILSRHTFEKMSILEMQQKALEVFDRYYAYEEIVGMRRIAKTMIPREAFREAVVNALVHRQWDIASHVRIAMFADRIEITSPGGLPEGVDEEAYLSGKTSIARNPILANIFFRLGYIERFGTGIPRIKEEYAKEEVSPRFDILENSITIVLPNVLATNLTIEEHMILEALGKVGEKTRAQIEEITGLSRAVTIAGLNSLIDKGYAKRMGAARSVKYACR